VPGVARLARWGLLDAVAASGCPPIRRMTVRLGDFTFRGTPTPVDGVADQYCVRRTILDTILVDAAAEAGAEVREGFGVDELLFDGDRVAGIRGRAPGGGDVMERARLVVGADGLHSLVAEAVDAPFSAAGPSLTCCSYAYWRGVHLDGAEVHAVGGRRRAASAWRMVGSPVTSRGGFRRWRVAYAVSHVLSSENKEMDAEGSNTDVPS